MDRPLSPADLARQLVGTEPVPGPSATGRYVDAEGHVFSVTRERAEALGLVPYDVPRAVPPRRLGPLGAGETRRRPAGS